MLRAESVPLRLLLALINAAQATPLLPIELLSDARAAANKKEGFRDRKKRRGRLVRLHLPHGEYISFLDSLQFIICLFGFL